MDTNSAQAKVSLREQAKRARRDWIEVGGSYESTEVCAGLADFLVHWFERYENHGCRRSDTRRSEIWTLTFLAMPDEPNLTELFSSQSMDGVTQFATTRTPTDSMDLTLHPMSSVFERHPYGYEQPVEGSETVDDSLVGAVLVPGLAFDLQGGRLGFGAGYYDRLLARLLLGREPDSIAIVGISDGFIVDSVPMQAHDVAMTHLATSAGVVAI